MRFVPVPVTTPVNQCGNRDMGSVDRVRESISKPCAAYDPPDNIYSHIKPWVQVVSVLHDVSLSACICQDRAFNDVRYSIDSSKLHSLGWQPEMPWEEGLRRTVEWYCKAENLARYARGRAWLWLQHQMWSTLICNDNLTPQASQQVVVWDGQVVHAPRKAGAIFEKWRCLLAIAL